MKTLTKLSARELEYYINVRHWKTDLDFLAVELDFIKLLEDAMELLGSDPAAFINASVFEKLADLMLDKEQVTHLLDVQLRNLELLAEAGHAKRPDRLSANQAQLEYQFNDLFHQFRDIKGFFYKQVRQVITNRKQSVSL